MDKELKEQLDRIEMTLAALIEALSEEYVEVPPPALTLDGEFAGNARDEDEEL